MDLRACAVLHPQGLAYGKIDLAGEGGLEGVES